VLGFLNPLYDAVAWVIMRIHAMLAVPFGADSGWAWGFSIVLLVVFLRLIMLPLFIKQVHAQQRMQQHMPQLQELRKKYKNDKQKLNEETMKYYRENGVNPLSGCLPLLAQFPVFISLFNVLRAIANWTPGHPTSYGLTLPVVESARRAHVFGVPLADTFLHSHAPWSVKGVILASTLISAGTTYLTMRQSMKRGMMQQGPVDPDNPMAQSQKIMVYIAPVFALSGLYWAYGLVIYWVTNNLWTFGQQFFLFRNLPIVDSTTAGSAVDQPSTGGKSAASTNKPAQPSRPAASRAGQPSGARPGGAGQGSKSASASSRTSSVSAATRSSTTASATQSGKSASSKTGQPVSGVGGVQAKSPKAASSGKTGSATETTGRGPADKQATQPAKATAGSGVNGSSAAAVSSAVAAGSEEPTGVRSLLRRGKAKPEPEPEAPQKTTVRQQPVRSTRSKRSGKR
jgi:YidC/Oxa1 family membrane protein insertase